ncbi:hypothetical protein DL765_004673 [Monosporascus sp. GIB2]|nr:hypothetical protein DL765_004673 [Monosporascus sp. GIB2]
MATDKAIIIGPRSVGALMHLKTGRTGREEAEPVWDVQYVRLDPVSSGRKCEMIGVEAVIDYLRTKQPLDALKDVTDKAERHLIAVSGQSLIGYSFSIPQYEIG